MLCTAVYIIPWYVVIIPFFYERLVQCLFYFVNNLLRLPKPRNLSLYDLWHDYKVKVLFLQHSSIAFLIVTEYEGMSLHGEKVYFAKTTSAL